MHELDRESVIDDGPRGRQGYNYAAGIRSFFGGFGEPKYPSTCSLWFDFLGGTVTL